jgi:hypothetical protein
MGIFFSFIFPITTQGAMPFPNYPNYPFYWSEEVGYKFIKYEIV